MLDKAAANKAVGNSYQLKIKRSKVKATRSLSRFIHDQPMQLGSSNLACLSALVRRGEKSRSLPHWYLFITLLDPCFDLVIALSRELFD